MIAYSGEYDQKFRVKVFPDVAIDNQLLLA